MNYEFFITKKATETYFLNTASFWRKQKKINAARGAVTIEN